MPKRCQHHDHPLVIFKKSKIHGTGGFARVDLRRGKRIIEYVGPRLSKAEAQAELDQHNAYLFSLDEDYDIDGSVTWNPARFLNHSCAPNCEAGIVRGRIWLYARRGIKAGEELTYNYGHGLEGYEERPCHCGASTCVGYMVAETHFDTIRPFDNDMAAEQRVVPQAPRRLRACSPDTSGLRPWAPAAER